MKKLILSTLALASASLFAQAQINKGFVLLGGGISASTGKLENVDVQTKNNAISFYPSIGVAVKENVVMGVRLSYSRSRSRQSNTSSPLKQDAESIGGGLFYRKYLVLSSKFFLFGEAAAYYLQNKQNTEDPSVSSTYN